MTDHPHWVIADYVGMIPDHGYTVFHTYPDAMREWETVAGTMRTPVNGVGDPFEADRDDYVTDRHDREARFEGPAPDLHDLLAVRIRRLLPAGAVVDVSPWAGCDEDWRDPVYVTATDVDEAIQFHDAVADLASAPLDEQVQYLVACLVHG